MQVSHGILHHLRAICVDIQVHAAIGASHGQCIAMVDTTVQVTEAEDEFPIFHVVSAHVSSDVQIWSEESCHLNGCPEAVNVCLAILCVLPVISQCVGSKTSPQGTSGSTGFLQAIGWVRPSHDRPVELELPCTRHNLKIHHKQRGVTLVKGRGWARLSTHRSKTRTSHRSGATSHIGLDLRKTVSRRPGCPWHLCPGSGILLPPGTRQDNHWLTAAAEHLLLQSVCTASTVLQKQHARVKVGTSRNSQLTIANMTYE